MKVPEAALVAELLSDGTQGYFEDAGGSGHVTQEEGVAHEEITIPNTLAAETTDTYVASVNATLTNEEESSLEFMLMVLVPLILLALLLLSVILLVTYYRRKRSKQEPSTQGSQNGLQTYELGSEHLKVPIFEEDTPSVMEIEMEELDKWMNSMNKNDDCGCLPPLKEEKEPNHSPSDSESQT